MITTVPGFSSRSSLSTVKQFPQRDGAVMEEQKPGWSNSDAAVVSGVSVSVELDDPNAEDMSEPVVEKVDEPAKPAKKTAAKKSAAKKG